SMRIRRILNPSGETHWLRAVSLAAVVVAGVLVLPLAGRTAAGGAGSLPIALDNPLKGSLITSPFGNRQNPISQAAEHHDGVDLVSPGEPAVRAPADGQVTVATSNYAPAAHLGTVIQLDHGSGVETFFAPL